MFFTKTYLKKFLATVTAICFCLVAFNSQICSASLEKNCGLQQQFYSDQVAAKFVNESDRSLFIETYNNVFNMALDEYSVISVQDVLDLSTELTGIPDVFSHVDDSNDSSSDSFSPRGSDSFINLMFINEINDMLIRTITNEPYQEEQISSFTVVKEVFTAILQHFLGC